MNKKKKRNKLLKTKKKTKKNAKKIKTNFKNVIFIKIVVEQFI